MYCATRSSSKLFFLGVLATAWLCSCAKSVPIDTDFPPRAAATPAPKTAAEPEQEGGAIERGDLNTVLHQGPAWLLSRVPLEEVLKKGKFIGWRVRELPLEWQGVDLRPGDVVTAVNTMPLETPTEFWGAWTTLTVASELKVAYLREGVARELSLPIQGTADPGMANVLQRKPNQAQPAKKRKRSKRFKTITIHGERHSPQPTVDWSNR